MAHDEHTPLGLLLRSGLGGRSVPELVARPAGLGSRAALTSHDMPGSASCMAASSNDRNPDALKFRPPDLAHATDRKVEACNRRLCVLPGGIHIGLESRCSL